ncbi:MAG: hypothetical protein P0107_04350 [Nitrosomonas sp.]|nr:hypothetical protein [Nitrosomonas sp.]
MKRSANEQGDRRNFLSAFVLGSTATFASGNQVFFGAGQCWIIWPAKIKPTDVVKSHTEVENGKIVRVNVAMSLRLFRRQENNRVTPGGVVINPSFPLKGLFNRPFLTGYGS